MSAVCEGFRDIAFELLRKGGARVPAKSVPDLGTATSPLHCAAERGDVELVESLIRVGGADVNKRDRAGRSALHLAAMEAGPHARTNYQPNISSYLRVIEALIKHGAVVEADGYSAIVPSHATTEKLLRNLNVLQGMLIKPEVGLKGCNKQIEACNTRTKKKKKKIELHLLHFLNMFHI